MSEESSALWHPALHLHALTHPGFVRPRNEDAYGLFTGAGLALLADGLGGGRAGEVASAMAVAIISEAISATTSTHPCVDQSFDEERLLKHERALRAAVTDANDAIQRQALAHPQYAGMGTTLVAAHWCGPQHLLIGHAGDSRAYRVHAQAFQVSTQRHWRHELHPLTRDHTTTQRDADARLVHSGVAGSRTPDTPPRLTRALGVEPEVVLELHRHRLAPGDLVMLCSDGLTDMLDEARVESLLNARHGRSPITHRDLPALSTALVDAALEAGGRDNITVVLGLWADAASPAQPPG